MSFFGGQVFFFFFAKKTCELFAPSDSLLTSVCSILTLPLLQNSAVAPIELQVYWNYFYYSYGSYRKSRDVYALLLSTVCDEGKLKILCCQQFFSDSISHCHDLDQFIRSI